MSFLQRARIDGERAVVTGGGRAIGLRCVEALAEAGASVVVIERSEVDAAEALSLRGKGHDVTLKIGDITDAKRMEAVADEMAAEGKPATILVNNAAIGLGGRLCETIPDADWLQTMDVNINGVFWTSRAFGRHMIEMRRGAIVNLGSMSGFIANRPETHTA